MNREVELLVRGILASNRHDRCVHISLSAAQQDHVHLLPAAPVTCLLALLNMHVLLTGIDTASKVS